MFKSISDFADKLMNFFCILENAATDIYYLRGMKNTLLCYILQIDSCYPKPT